MGIIVGIVVIVGGGGGGGEGVKLVRDEEQTLEIRLGSRIVSGDVGLDVEGGMPVLRWRRRRRRRRHGCDSVFRFCRYAADLRPVLYKCFWYVPYYFLGTIFRREPQIVKK